MNCALIFNTINPIISTHSSVLYFDGPLIWAFFVQTYFPLAPRHFQSTQGVSVWNYPEVRDHLNVCLREVLEDVQDVAVNLRSRQYQAARKWIDSIGGSVVLEAVSLNVTAEIDRLDQPGSLAREKYISQSTY